MELTEENIGDTVIIGTFSNAVWPCIAGEIIRHEAGIGIRSTHRKMWSGDHWREWTKPLTMKLTGCKTGRIRIVTGPSKNPS